MGMICMRPAAPDALWACGVHLDSHHITLEMVRHCSTGQPTAKAVGAHSAQGPSTAGHVGTVVASAAWTVTSTRAAGCVAVTVALTSMTNRATTRRSSLTACRSRCHHRPRGHRRLELYERPRERPG